MAGEDNNRGAFAIQRRYCAAMDAPITGRVVDAVADALDRDTAIGRRIIDWPGEPTADAVPLRIVGGLHALAQAGDPALARLFAPDGPEGGAAAAIVHDAFARRDAELQPWLDGPPQTNEAGRSGALMVGLTAVARRFGQPVDLLEIGSSAGLNLLVDRLRYDLGGVTIGPANAPVTIRPDWRGPAPEPIDLRFAQVRGVDVAPLDVGDPATARRLAGYVWADHPERLGRLAATIAMIRERPVDLVAGEAADWLEAQLAEPQAAGTTRVLVHSVVWQYLGDARQQRIAAAMREAGARADAQRPLAWVAMEPDRGLKPRMEVTVRSWPDGAPPRVVALAQSHGAWVEPV